MWRSDIVTRRFLHRVILFILVCCCSLNAKTNLNDTLQEKYPAQFEYLSLPDTLSITQIQDILQDSRGFMWFASKEKLYRFDGYDFLIFPKDMAIRTAWENYNLTRILEDKEGNIWIGSEKGLYRLNRGKEKIEPVDSVLTLRISKLSTDFITALFKDRQSQIWVGTMTGIYILDPSKKNIERFSPKTRESDIIGNEVIKEIAENPAREILIATNKGLYRIDPGKRDVQIFEFGDKKSVARILNSLTKMVVDHDGTIWMGTAGEGLFYLPAQKTEFIRMLHNPSDPNSISANFINAVCEDSQDRLWIGFQGTGINIYSMKSRNVSHLRQDPLDAKSLNNDTITSLFMDKSSTIWIGTRSSGLNYWNPFSQKFRLFRNTQGNSNNLNVLSVHSICEDNRGKIWIAGYDGLDRFDPVSVRFEHIPKNIWGSGQARVIYTDRNHRDSALWLGISNGQFELVKLNQDSYQVIKKYDMNTFSDFRGTAVITLLAENEKTLWIGTDQGIYKMDTAGEQFIPLLENLSNTENLNDDQINILYRDRNKKIWAGTSHNGLICFDTINNQLVRFLFSPDDINSLSINEVISIMEDQQGQLWIGTSRGLNQFDEKNNSFERYTKKNGLPDNTICGILPGSDNDLWLSTNRGLSRFNIQDQTFRNFDMEDGLQSYNFNRGAYLKSSDGELYFGGLRGLNCFYPQEAQINPYMPPVRITDLKIFNKSVLVGESKSELTHLQKTISEMTEIKLLPREKVFTLNFAALNYISPQKNEYAIKMEGLDKDWNQIGYQRFATYSGLHPGEYVFKVKASNNEGLWNQEGTSIKISITPPFFSRGWVRISGFLLFLLIIFLIHTFRVFSLKRKNQQLKNNCERLDLEITEFRNADEKIRTSERKYRHLVESSNDAIYILFNRKFELINQKFKDIFKVSQEYVTSPDFDFLELVSMKSKNFVEKKIQKIIEGEKTETQFNYTALSREKKELEVEASVTTITYQDSIAVQGILRDITERKNMEKMIQQAQKLEALGTLAGGIAHDFNNLLTGIQGRVSLMQMGFDKKDSPKDHLNEIEHYVRNAADLTKQLLGFARKGKFEVKPINMNHLVKENVMMFGRTRKEIAIRAQYQEELWTVEVDPGQMDQVFMNLFVNAWQAMPDGGDILIETRNVYLDHLHTRPHMVNPGKFVKVSVTDTGKGMDEDTKQRIFDPFFTTKERGRGTGLGLATVYGILKNHGGFITVHSELNIGSTFDIFLPASSKRAVVEIAPKEELLYGSETVMLVDDEEIVIEVVGQILESLGYNVYVAHSGKEAIEIYWAHKDQIDLVILDMVMPQMSGSVTYERLRGIDPKVKVLLSSGYSVDGQASELLKKGCNGFIQKPFNTKELSKKIREVLDENPDKPGTENSG